MGVAGHVVRTSYRLHRRPTTPTLSGDAPRIPFAQRFTSELAMTPDRFRCYFVTKDEAGKAQPR